MEHDFIHIDYLTTGNIKQKGAYKIMQELNIMEVLQAYNPILAGTIPIGIDVPDSDLDIICEVYHFDPFKRLLAEQYGAYDRFAYKTRTVNEVPRAVCHFTVTDTNNSQWMFEVFGQPVPTAQQNAYKHMIVEHKILNLLGSVERDRIVHLKRQGIKTEPAFGKLLNTDDDPYRLLLDMYHWDDKRLREYVLESVR
jgi:hypothetical protein